MTTFGRAQLRAHVDVLKSVPGGGQVVVHTSRPCSVCGLPLIGAVTNIDGKQVHATSRCAGRKARG